MRWWRLPIEERACRETDLGGGDYYLRNSGLPPSLKLLKKPCTVRVGAKYRRTDVTLGGSNTNPAIVRVRGKTGCGPWSAFLPSSSFLGLFGIPFAWITEGTWNFNEFSAFVGKLFCSARFSSYDHKMWLNATSLRTRAHYFCNTYETSDMFEKSVTLLPRFTSLLLNFCHAWSVIVVENFNLKSKWQWIHNKSLRKLINVDNRLWFPIDYDWIVSHKKIIAHFITNFLNAIFLLCIYLKNFDVDIW